MPESLPSTSPSTSATATPTPQASPPPAKTHILITGASSGIGRAFFEHFSSFPPTTHYVRGVDARPFPTNPKISTCAVGACGHYAQIDLTAEALVQKFVRGATVPGAAARSRASSSSSSASPSPIQTHHHHHHHQPGQPSLTPPANSNNHNSGSGSDNEPPYAAPFTLVIHSAGIRGLVPSIAAATPADVGAAETIAAMDAATMRRTYEVNAVATFTLIKALLPSLLLAARTRPPAARPPTVVVMSSRMGSVASNAAGGAYAYRASKAALNAVVRSFSVDVPEVLFALVHPGRVETGLVRAREEGAVEVQESVEDMLALIGRLGTEEGLRSGCFVDRWGKEIPW
ncbi:Glucose/ribitol dehydrogenase [Neofusicoccum parvum]|nr:Glucose/ribitol dehydrogenase [Neofusicoccum parvum]